MHTDPQAARQSIFNDTIAQLAAMMPARPSSVILGPDGRPVTSAQYTFERSAAKREGSMRNWIPRRLLSRSAESRDRERILERSIDLCQSDPNVAGIISGQADAVIGSGLKPYPAIDYELLGITKEAARGIQRRQKAIYNIWAPHADASGRLHDGQIQYLKFYNMLAFGEYIMLLPMVQRAARPYNLACQMIHPLRLKTPVDKINDPNIRDGINFDGYGAAKGYWIKKSSPGVRYLNDNSENFVYVRAAKGHRINVIHRYVQTDPEQVRGIPMIAPALKMFRDLSDYLDAELVSNMVTAAFSMFIETPLGQNPLFPAQNTSTERVTGTDRSGRETTERYQELTPGLIMYGATGQKPHPITANRPGTSFDPFTKAIKSATALACGLPYVIAYKDVADVNFAGFRSAMLDAWRVYSTKRVWMGQDNSIVWGMLQEEAYLRGDIPEIKYFYTDRHFLTRCDWRGAPKGDIEPVKQVQAQVLKIKHNLDTRSSAIIENGGDPQAVFDGLEEERDILTGKGLTDPDAPEVSPDTPDNSTAACADCGWSGHVFDLKAVAGNPEFVHCPDCGKQLVEKD